MSFIKRKTKKKHDNNVLNKNKDKPNEPKATVPKIYVIILLYRPP